MNNMKANALIWTGWAGLLGALLVGIGEFTLQFSPEGGYEATDYSYFTRISVARLTAGHFFSVLAAPLYLLGYWHIGQMFIRGGSKISGWFITLFGGYAFVVGTAWLGGRVYLALTAKELAEASTDVATVLGPLLEQFAFHNEPLVNALRLAMLIISLLWAFQILQERTLYPRWMAIISPILLLGIIFAIYFFIFPPLGAYSLPAAMNVVHVIIFGLSVYCAGKVNQPVAETEIP